MRAADRRADRAVLLTPGAGAGRDQPSLVAVEQALEPMAVERMDFPYRLAGRSRPDRAEILVAAVRNGAAALAERTALAPGRLVLGGRSMGGRICSMAVAEGLDALGLVLISYPLHPPGRPDRLRTEHFDRLDRPCLFLSGTRDAFATPDELEQATMAIPGEVTHVWLDGGDHGLRRRDGDVAAVVRDWIASLH
ncbi:MAG: dienelactone hydrolase [Actinomycetota bacterium]|nr:dienelactone hydrolase [Actinomycetota bacterium]